MYFLIAANVQDLRGAFHSGMGAHNDEPAHVVTGVMASEYLANHAFTHPLRFAEDYYLHYPKVVMGHYPPVFYGIQALWMNVFGISGGSLIMLMSLMMALVATMIAFSLLEECGGVGAGIMGLLFVVMPMVQEYGGMVMTEVPLAFFCTLALIQFGRFLDSESRGDAVLFGLWASVAIMTRGSALALGLVPPIALCLANRVRVLLRPAIWYAAGTVAVVCAPWYWVTLGIATRTWAGGPSPSWEYAMVGLPHHLNSMLKLGGVSALVMASLGVVSLYARPTLQGKWFALMAFPPSLVAMHCIIPANTDERYMIPAAPALIMLVAVGAAAVTKSRALGPSRLAKAAPWLLFVGLFLAETFELPRKQVQGFASGVHAVMSIPALDDSVVLIASDGLGEGAFVAAAALAEPDPKRIILRASNVLCHDDFYGGNYQALYPTRPELEQRLREIPVGVIALDSSMRSENRAPHHAHLREVIDARPELWNLVVTVDIVRNGTLFPDALSVYRQVGHQRLPRLDLRLTDVQGQ